MFKQKQYIFVRMLAKPKEMALSYELSYKLSYSCLIVVLYKRLFYYVAKNMNVLHQKRTLRRRGGKRTSKFVNVNDKPVFLFLRQRLQVRINMSQAHRTWTELLQR